MDLSRDKSSGSVFRLWSGGLLTISIVLEAIVRANGWFETFPWIDNPMHFLWGANVFWICLWAFRCRPATAWLLVLVWQILWESGEMLGDWLVPQPAYMIDHLWPDGVKDTVMDLLGGLALWFVLVRLHGLSLPLPPWRRGKAQAIVELPSDDPTTNNIAVQARQVAASVPDSPSQ